jgi:cysteine dioxygenase
MLDRLALASGEFDRFIRFDPARYRRNPVAEGPHFQLLVVCWRSGQRSPIHSHDGSACGLKVVSGIATEVAYDVVTNPARPQPISTRRLGPAAVATSFDRDVHRITAAEGDLVTLHVYSPPLRAMTVYPDGGSEPPPPAARSDRPSDPLSSRAPRCGAVPTTPEVP